MVGKIDIQLTLCAVTCISACRIDIVEIPKATPIISRYSNSLDILPFPPLLSGVSGSGKSKMAAAKPELPISQLVDQILSKFQ